MRVSQRNGREMKLHQSSVLPPPRSFAVSADRGAKISTIYAGRGLAIIIYPRGNLGVES